jgi:hypothetical protein
VNTYRTRAVNLSFLHPQKPAYGIVNSRGSRVLNYLELVGIFRLQSREAIVPGTSLINVTEKN